MMTFEDALRLFHQEFPGWWWKVARRDRSFGQRPMLRPPWRRLRSLSMLAGARRHNRVKRRPRGKA
jgi:hypothetical protein